MDIHLCTMSLIFYLLYPAYSLDIVIIHMSDYQATLYSYNFLIFLKIQQQKRGFSMMMVIYSKVSCL